MNEGYLKIIVLKELNRKDCTGYELIKKTGEISGRKPSAGSIYPLLNDLLNKKLVIARQQGRKKPYSITKTGKDAVAKLISEKEDAIMRNIEVMRLVSDITGDRNIKPMIKILNAMKSKGGLFLINIDLWAELRGAAMNISMSRDYPKKQERLRRVLKKAISELKSIR